METAKLGANRNRLVKWVRIVISGLGIASKSQTNQSTQFLQPINVCPHPRQPSDPPGLGSDQYLYSKAVKIFDRYAGAGIGGFLPVIFAHFFDLPYKDEVLDGIPLSAMLSLSALLSSFVFRDIADYETARFLNLENDALYINNAKTAGYIVMAGMPVVTFGIGIMAEEGIKTMLVSSIVWGVSASLTYLMTCVMSKYYWLLRHR